MVQKVSRPQRYGPIGVVAGGAGASLRVELLTDKARGQTPRSETLDAIRRTPFSRGRTIVVTKYEVDPIFWTRG